ncbi:MAG: T9SS type A sorting domain-containing protein [Flavobacteriales bacterium]
MMKRPFFFLLFFLLLAEVDGQFSLNDADMPGSAPRQYRYSQGTLGPTAPPLSKTGNGVTWGYMDIQRVGQRVDSFFQVSNTPLAYRAKFDNPFDPGYQADHAKRAQGLSSDSLQLPVQIEDRFDYFKKANGAYELLGFGARVNGIPSSSKFVPKDTVYPHPLQYGVKDSSYARMVFDNVPGLYYQQERWRQVEVDGMGALITPYEHYDKVLRVRTELRIRDSLKSDSLGIDFAAFRPTKVLYEWLAKDEGVPVLRIVTRNGTVNSVEYRDTVATNTSVDLSPRKEEGPRLYPNPVVSELHLSVEPGRWDRAEIWTLRGKRMEARELKPGRADLEIKLGGLSSGVYLLRLKGEERQFRKKLIKVDGD